MTMTRINNKYRRLSEIHSRTGLTLLFFLLFLAIALPFLRSVSAPERNRTSDTRYRKPLLYPLSYRRISHCLS